MSNVEALRKELKECLDEFEKLRPKIETEAADNPQIRDFLVLADKIKVKSAVLLPKKPS